MSCGECTQKDIDDIKAQICTIIAEQRLVAPGGVPINASVAYTQIAKLLALQVRLKLCATTGIVPP